MVINKGTGHTHTLGNIKGKMLERLHKDDKKIWHRRKGEHTYTHTHKGEGDWTQVEHNHTGWKQNKEDSRLINKTDTTVTDRKRHMFLFLNGLSCVIRARPDHYFPDLHHLKFEIEEGTMLDGRPVRFGYNPLEFKDFSWRGYAQMSPIQVGRQPPHSLVIMERYRRWKWCCKTATQIHWKQWRRVGRLHAVNKQAWMRLRRGTRGAWWKPAVVVTFYHIKQCNSGYRYEVRL